MPFGDQAFFMHKKTFIALVFSMKVQLMGKITCLSGKRINKTFQSDLPSKV